MNNAVSFSKFDYIAKEPIESFFRSSASMDDQDVIMDIGCGPGVRTLDFFLPLFPQVGSLLALDVSTNMIQFARTYNSHPNIEYHVANIEDWATVRQWAGTASKIVSAFCLNWLQDVEAGLQNCFGLLQPGAEAVLISVLRSPIWDAALETAASPRWSAYMKNFHFGIPESHYKKLDARHYKPLLERIGFQVRMCENCEIVQELDSDEEATEYLSSVCALVERIPVLERKDFEKDFFNKVVKHSGRSPNRKPLYRSTAMKIVARK